MRRSASLLALLPLLVACDAPPPAPAAALRSVPPVDSATIRLAGTGAMTPLASRLARAWSASSGSPRVLVEPSVGSSGGVRAAADGAVDIGMIARPLSSAESSLGLVSLPVATDAVVLAAHQDVPADNLRSSEVLALFSGEVARYPDGSPATVLLRDRSDSAHSAFERLLPELRPVREHAYETRRFRVIYHDDVMGSTLASSPGALGVFSLGAVLAWHLPVKVLALDGVTPSVDRVQDGSWKALRSLSFVLRPDRQAHVAPFLQFIASEEGRTATRASGYLPAGEATP